MKKSVPFAAAGIAALVLAGGSLTGVTAANAADTGGKAPQQMAKAAKKSAADNCNGGAAIAMTSRTGGTTTISGYSTTVVDGSAWTIKGPKHGTDSVLVTVSGLAYAPSLMYGGVYKDGSVSGSLKYVAYSSGYDGTSAQFCTKVGKGFHNLDVRLYAEGSSTDYFYNPTVTYQRFN